MRKKSLVAHVFLVIVLYAAAIGFAFIMPKIKEGKHLWVSPPLEIQYFTLGYNDVIADSFWIRFLQDVGVCEQESRGNHLNQDGVRRGRDRVPECRFGWGYHMLNLITEIAPRFHLAASIGPISLSVIADDIEGASALFEKALKLFPNDWLLHYQAGYHHLFELEDKGAALAHFERANLLGAPGWLPLLIARLHSELGRQAVAVSVLKSLIEKGHHDRRVIERAENKLKSLLQKETGE